MGRFATAVQGTLARLFPDQPLPSEVNPIEIPPPSPLEREHVTSAYPEAKDEREALYVQAIEMAEEETALMFEDVQRLMAERDALKDEIAERALLQSETLEVLDMIASWCEDIQRCNKDTPETRGRKVLKLNGEMYEGPVVDWVFEYNAAINKMGKALRRRCRKLVKGVANVTS
jgi:hypothetical protein